MDFKRYPDVYFQKEWIKTYLEETALLKGTPNGPSLTRLKNTITGLVIHYTCIIVLLLLLYYYCTGRQSDSVTDEDIHILYKEVAKCSLVSQCNHFI